MIEARGLRYEAPGGRTLLEGIDLRVARGERLGIVGPSGSGKTTLGCHLCGIHHLALGGRSSGSLLLDGREAIRGGARGFGGAVLQNPEHQLLGRTVEEDAGLGRPGDLEGLLDRTGLAPHRKRPVATLSLGWKQRLSIAGMLAASPRALLLDEPASFLDPGAARDLFALLGGLGDTAVIVVDHDEGRLSAWADRVIRLEAGRLAASPAPAEDGLPDPGPLPSPGAPLLQAEGVSFAFAHGTPVVEDFSLTLREGEAVALLGPNGSGKTTLLRLAKGLLRPSSGTFRAASGRPLLREVGLVYQNPDESLFAATVEEEAAFLPRNQGLGREAAAARAASALARLGIGHLARRSPFSLSFGEKRRAGIAAVLSGGHRVLCLDEPTAGLDRESRRSLAALLRDLAAQGAAILLATHDEPFAAAIGARKVRLGATR